MVPPYEPGKKVELYFPPSYTLPVNKLMIWKEKYLNTVDVFCLHFILRFKFDENEIDKINFRVSLSGFYLVTRKLSVS